LRGVQAGEPSLEAADVLGDRKIEAQQRAGRVLGRRIGQIVVPEQPPGDLGALGDDRAGRVG
jgi:hypothetical protein